MPSANLETICVTGANGFLGSHVVAELLRRGYRVRATVRDPNDPLKTEHLKSLPGADDRLEFVRGDVLSETGWDEALEPADALVHCATVVRMYAKNPQADIVDVAVEGTRHVLSAAARSAKTRHVVHLSSISAMIDYARPESHVFGSDDWCEGASLEDNPYGLAKARSEKLARELSEPNGQASGFRLASVNPGYALGPLLCKRHVVSSASVVRDILTHKFPGCPAIQFNPVHVYDVAEGSANALENPELNGRYPLTNSRMWWVDFARTLADAFPQRKIRTNVLPAFLLYLNALFDPRVNLAFTRHIVGREVHIDGQASAQALGIEYRPAERAVLETAESILELGLVEDRP